MIENKDWVYNPDDFHYKLSEGEAPRQGTLASIQEFGVYNFSRYVRAIVQFDRSKSYPVKELSNQWTPEWETDTLFLKNIIQGNASLYYYEVHKLKKFFFTSPTDSSIRQLVYKQYYIGNATMRDNVTFKQQLINEVRCEMPSENYFQKVTYDMFSLKKHFEKYNQCMGNDVKSFDNIVTENKVQRDLFNFKLNSGINYSSLYFNYSGGAMPLGKEILFSKKAFLRFGAEIEYILGFNKNKWSVFIEPSYQEYNNKKDYIFNNGMTYTHTVNYRSFETSFGLRHYFFLNSNSKLFINLIFLPPAITYLNNSQIIYARNNDIGYGGVKFEIKSRTTYGLGIGYNWDSIYLEGRYSLKQGITGNYTNIFSQYQRLSIIVGYHFLKLKTKSK